MSDEIKPPEGWDKHTPGPWHWHDTFGRKNGKGNTLCGKNVFGEEPPMGQCSHFSYAVSDEQGFCVAHCTGALVTMSSERSESNARLIAAAPELLEAVKDTLEGCDGLPEHRAFCERLRKLINKAEGN